MIEGLFDGIPGIAVETFEFLLIFGLCEGEKRTMICAGLGWSVSVEMNRLCR